LTETTLQTTEEEQSKTPNASAGLPRRDFVILPLLSLATLLMMFGVTEAATRIFAPEVRFDSCRYRGETGDRYRANCTSKTKLFDGPWVVNQYNDCGYRSRASCGAKPLGTIRIAVLGTSAATGFLVPYEQTVWGIMEQELTNQCRRPVEVQNLSVFGTGLNLAEQAHRMDEALTLKPDAVILMASGNDLPGVENWRPGKAADVVVAGPEARVGQASHTKALMDEVKLMVRRSAVMTEVRYALYQDDQSYLKIYMSTQGDDMGYLRVPFSPLWQKRIKIFDELLSGMAAKAKEKNVPFVLVPSIFRAQVLLFHLQNQFPGIDAYAFDRETAAMAQKYGIVKFDVSDDFAQVKETNKTFYVTDGHFSAAGHAVFAGSVIRQIHERKMLAGAGCAADEVAR
jgi:lysophospholipase L1-like esterase